MRVRLVKRGEAVDGGIRPAEVPAGDFVTVCGPPDALFDVRPAFRTGFEPLAQSTRRDHGRRRDGRVPGPAARQSPFRLRVIEPDRDRGEILAERFPHIAVIHGQGTSLRLLEEEHVGDADFFVACTRDDEENIMACLQARKLGARKLFLAINRADYTEVVQTSRVGARHRRRRVAAADDR